MSSHGLEPQEREDFIRIKYWACNVLGHRHRNRQSAAACITIRKGESGKLRKLRRDISMLKELRAQTPLATIARLHYCSDTNITLAVNSALERARTHASHSCPYPRRRWRREDFSNGTLQDELTYLVNILKEMEVILSKMVKP